MRIRCSLFSKIHCALLFLLVFGLFQDGKAQVKSAEAKKKLSVVDLSVPQKETSFKRLGMALDAAAMQGEKLVGVEEEGPIHIWDGNGQMLFSFPSLIYKVTRVVFSPNNERVAFLTQANTVQVVDIVSKKDFPYFHVPGSLILAAAFSPEGQKIVTASSNGKAYLWEVNTGKLIASLAGHKGWINDVKFSPDGKWIITAGDDQTARIWNAEGNYLQNQLLGEHKEAILALALSPDGQKLVTMSGEEVARVWNTKQGNAVAALPGHKEGILSGAFSKNACCLVTAGRDETARVWDVDKSQLLASLRDHKGFVIKVAISPNGKYVATVDESQTVRVWEVSSETILFQGQGVSKSRALDLIFSTEKQVRLIYENGYLQTINLS